MTLVSKAKRLASLETRLKLRTYERDTAQARVAELEQLLAEVRAEVPALQALDRALVKIKKLEAASPALDEFARRILDACVSWADDTGDCHFCGMDDVGAHHPECLLWCGLAELQKGTP